MGRTWSPSLHRVKPDDPVKRHLIDGDLRGDLQFQDRVATHAILKMRLGS